MIKFILNKLKIKIKYFLLNKSNDSIPKKIYYKSLLDDLNKRQKNLYALDGFKVYSQNDEDGIIDSIFKDIGTTNKLFCEIGIGNCIENNTHYLVLKDWKGLWVDCEKKYLNKLNNLIKNNNKLETYINKVDGKNINSIFLKSKIINTNNIKEIDFFSIDIDSYDLDCLNSLEVISPRLICIEYNSKFRSDLEINIKKKNKYIWQYDDYFGSSLMSIYRVMRDKKYNLIATNITGSNAFFVKENLYEKCKTKNQSIDDLYTPPNFDLLSDDITHLPSNKYLIDKINE